MANAVKLNVVVSDVEMIATVLERVQRSDFSGEITVAVQPSSRQPVPVSRPESAPGSYRTKIIQGL